MPRFTFPPASSLEQLGVLFKDCCRRLWTILAAEGGLYPKCVHCRGYTCSQDCLEEASSKIVLDIGRETYNYSTNLLFAGGKLTWIINANFGLKKHMSMIAVPKLLRCYDCDSFIDRTGTQVKLLQETAQLKLQYAGPLRLSLAAIRLPPTPTCWPIREVALRQQLASVLAHRP